MKKIFFNKVSLAICLISTLVSACTKNNTTVDVSALSAPTAAQFVPPTGVNQVNYYVKSTNAPYMIPVGLTNIASVDRQVQLTYTSLRATAGTQYNAPASVTIKAGASNDSIAFGGLFSGYPTGRKDTVKVKFSGINTVLNRDSFVLIIQGYCDVIAANLTGNYANTLDYYPSVGSGASASKYTATISSWTPVTATTATIVIQNLGLSPDTGFGPFGATDPAKTGITATVDWTDPANFKVTIPSQAYMASLYSYGAATISGSGIFSSCDQTFTLGYSIKVSAGSFTNQWTVLKK